MHLPHFETARWFFRSLVSTTNTDVDEMVVGGLVALTFMIMMTGWDVIHNSKPFDVWSFASAYSMLLASIGGGRRLRDGIGGKAPPELPQTPEKPPQGQ